MFGKSAPCWQVLSGSESLLPERSFALEFLLSMLLLEAIVPRVFASQIDRETSCHGCNQPSSLLRTLAHLASMTRAESALQINCVELCEPRQACLDRATVKWPVDATLTEPEMLTR